MAMKKILKLATILVSLLTAHLSFPVKVSDAQSLPAACASANVTNPQGKPIGFLTGPEFLNNGSMTLQDIRDYLRRDDIKSWYAGDPKTNLIEDTDSTPSKPVFIDFAQLVFDHAAHPNDTEKPPVSKKPINPQLILTMIRKESSTFQLRKKPDITQLACVAGCGCVKGVIHTIRSQIACAARTLRNRFDELAACADTPNDPVWNLNKPSSGTANKTQDGINVTPSNAATVAHFPYNPVAGVEWGGRTDKGGVALFCTLWHRDMDKRPGRTGCATPPTKLTLSPTNPTLTCSHPLTPISPRTVDYRNVTLSVSGGTPPYTWSVTTNIKPTNATIPACGANGEDAVLKPPVNNPNAGGGEAYKLTIVMTEAGHISFNKHGCGQRCNTYDCNDVFQQQTCLVVGPRPSCPVPPAAFHCAENLGAGHIGHECSPPCPNPVIESNTCLPNVLEWTQLHGNVCDTRTQAQINDGCRPCRLEMQGATVTVTDAAGASSSAAVTVQ